MFARARCTSWSPSGATIAPRPVKSCPSCPIQVPVGLAAVGAIGDSVASKSDWVVAVDEANTWPTLGGAVAVIAAGTGRVIGRVASGPRRPSASKARMERLFAPEKDLRG